MADYRDSLSRVDTLTHETALNTLNEILDKHGVGLGRVMQALRVAVTGVAGGPDLMGIIVVLGQKEVADRIDNALNNI